MIEHISVLEWRDVIARHYADGLPGFDDEHTVRVMRQRCLDWLANLDAHLGMLPREIADRERDLYRESRERIEALHDELVGWLRDRGKEP